MTIRVGLLVVVLVAALPFLALSIVSTRASQDAARVNVQVEALNQAEATAERMSRFLAESNALLVALGRRLVFSSGAIDDNSEYLRSVRALLPDHYGNLIALDPAGRLVGTSAQLEPHARPLPSFQDWPEVGRALETPRLVVGGLQDGSSCVITEGGQARMRRPWL